MFKPKVSLRITAAASPAVRESPGNSSRGTPSPAWDKCKSIAHATVNEKQSILNISRWKKPLNIVKPIISGDEHP